LIRATIILKKQLFTYEVDTVIYNADLHWNGDGFLRQQEAVYRHENGIGKEPERLQLESQRLQKHARRV
jgi:hypothetical protein